MKYITIVLIMFLLSLFLACVDAKQKPNQRNHSTENHVENELEETPRNVSDKLCDRISVPKNYKRVTNPESSFGYFLRNLQLKPESSSVTYYNGSF